MVGKAEKLHFSDFFEGNDEIIIKSAIRTNFVSQNLKNWDLRKKMVKKFFLKKNEKKNFFLQIFFLQVYVLNFRNLSYLRKVHDDLAKSERQRQEELEKAMRLAVEKMRLEQEKKDAIGLTEDDTDAPLVDRRQCKTNWNKKIWIQRVESFKMSIIMMGPTTKTKVTMFNDLEYFLIFY